MHGEQGSQGSRCQDRKVKELQKSEPQRSVLLGVAFVLKEFATPKMSLG